MCTLKSPMCNSKCKKSNALLLQSLQCSSECENVRMCKTHSHPCFIIWEHAQNLCIRKPKCELMHQNIAHLWNISSQIKQYRSLCSMSILMSEHKFINTTALICCWVPAVFSCRYVSQMYCANIYKSLLLHLYHV